MVSATAVPNGDGAAEAAFELDVVIPVFITLSHSIGRVESLATTANQVFSFELSSLVFVLGVLLTVHHTSVVGFLALVAHEVSEPLHRELLQVVIINVC